MVLNVYPLAFAPGPVEGRLPLLDLERDECELAMKLHHDASPPSEENPKLLLDVRGRSDHYR